jgi:hypothetical protein
MISMNKRMKGLLLVAALGAGVGSTGVALAQGPVPVGGTMGVSPATVEPGGSYVISNDPESPCTLGEVVGDTGGIRPGAWFVEPDENGDWSVTIEVPDSGPPDAMGNPTPFPAGEYEQHAFCQLPTPAGVAAAGQQQSFNYEPVIVTVVAPEEPAPPAPPAPPAAAPTTAAPTFTG